MGLIDAYVAVSDSATSTLKDEVFIKLGDTKKIFFSSTKHHLEVSINEKKDKKGNVRSSETSTSYTHIGRLILDDETLLL